MREQPQIVIPDSVVMPRAGIRTAKNGVKIYTLQSDDFEVVRFTFVFKAGSTTQHKPFAASSTANMLGEGSTSLSAQEIAEKLGRPLNTIKTQIRRAKAAVCKIILDKE